MDREEGESTARRKESRGVQEEDRLYMVTLQQIVTRSSNSLSRQRIRQGRRREPSEDRRCTHLKRFRALTQSAEMDVAIGPVPVAQGSERGQ